ncbi:helix-turn-helix domain-containing protein [Paenibacillus pasadenensis]|uniref:helix-turn-helix domain-containing protein n=1 Tax=Paenibacillus pasadenensis TaxID=217090 RepID=UPI00203F5FEC|nr:helix-turn-helix domain-containing protein [Paenibacillus pasadenensis]MCM3747523.1 helix-turn-helix domain-containing protein [Paenibacillus pasadenensis]
MRVLVVEDDHLVRRGFISLMPWQRYGLEVAGEAINGEQALEFLEHNDVDLLFTDLLMPVMGGLELMRQVNVKFPHIGQVVLTFHEEFEYIQEALRIGALDYMIKADFSLEQMDAVLERILARIGRVNGTGATNRLTHDHGYLLYYLGDECNDAEPQENQTSLFALNVQWIDRNLWWLEDMNHQTDVKAYLLEIKLPRYWAIVEWTGIRGHDRNRLRTPMKQFTDSLYFIYDRDCPYYTQPYTAAAVPGENSRHLLLAQNNEWALLDWITDDTVFEVLLQRLYDLRPDRSLLESYFFAVSAKWQERFGVSFVENNEIVPFPVWQDLVEWLGHVRKKIKSVYKLTEYSDEIIREIMKTVQFMENEFQKELSIMDAAKFANMSRSYFSRCFHDITGHTFNEYLRMVRISHAKTLLKQSSKPISWVAYQSGYPNEKYFCKVFRKVVGLQPREYRALS